MAWEMSVEEPDGALNEGLHGSGYWIGWCSFAQRAHQAGSKERVPNERAYAPDFHMRGGAEVVVDLGPGSCRAAAAWSWGREARGADPPRKPASPRRSLAGATNGAGTAVELRRLPEARRRVTEAPFRPTSWVRVTGGLGVGLCSTLAPGQDPRALNVVAR